MPDIHKILIANRGEIARRVIRTAHRMGIATVAVHSDVDANALHVREATQSHALGGNTSADTYLRIDKLLAAARATGADAVHPGYGFLSENADCAQTVVDAGLVWIGPPPEAIRALGSKSAAKQVAERQGVPVLPGYHGADQSDDRLWAEAQRIGAPLMVKAAAGGGGRGMRLVTDLAQLPDAVRSARSEALSAFGSGELLLERALLNPRHVEVQVFADAHGGCVHLGERDCSVQRRHQKIIEETPSPGIDAALRERMGACAVALARGAGYVGAGTVEFLVEGDQFYLMEMNTRLQVEHPVTEMVTGLDLVEWQIRVARSERLPLAQEQLRFAGHAIEVRLCAEDEHFHPHTGRVLHFAPPPSADGLRLDHAIERGGDVSPHYDSMLGKLIVHAPSRHEAIDRLTRALAQLQLLGLPTNRAMLIACLQHPQFRAGAALIPFLSEHGDALRAQLHAAERAMVQQHGFDALWLQAVQRPQAGRTPGGGLACTFPRPLRLRHRGDTLDDATPDARRAARLLDASVGTGTGSGPGVAAVTLQQPGRADRIHLQQGAIDAFMEDLSFEAPASARGDGGAGELRAPFNGKVIALKAAPGDAVGAGAALVVIESMKIEHVLSLPRAGRVARVQVSVGQQVGPGQMLVTLEDA
ncbi:MAG: hypothetical protein RL014_473 [Pseudomonadota bacterium]|jgi:3-methylcrotonyl-CoA carboxylase alpha subunit/geranyl-CoA carboxylase alpha subunit